MSVVDRSNISLYYNTQLRNARAQLLKYCQEAKELNLFENNKYIYIPNILPASNSKSYETYI